MTNSSAQAGCGRAQTWNLGPVSAGFRHDDGVRLAAGRVVCLDGCAGPGRYERETGETIGASGSPLLAVKNASSVAQWARDLHCVFIERDSAYVDILRQVLLQEGPATLRFDVLEGDVEARLDDALAITGDSPLLAFLDPVGTAPGRPPRVLDTRGFLTAANVVRM